MQCRVCAHKQRVEIETAAARPGASLVEIALRFGVAVKALERHASLHPRAAAKPEAAPPPRRRPRAKRQRAISPPPPPPAPILEDDEEAPITSRSPQHISAREKLDQLFTSLKRLADELPSDSSVADRIAILRASAQPIRLLAQLTGELGASESSVVASPTFKRMLGAILEALRPYAAARQAVIEALEREQRGAAVEVAA